MSILKTTFQFMIIAIFSSCSNSDTNKKKSADTVIKAKDTTIETQARLSKDNKPNIPVSHDDSLKVLTYKQLQSYMPQILGYKKGLTGGETLSNATSGGRQSYARQEYYSKKEKIIIEIVDYSLAEESLKDLMSMYEKNAMVENAAVSLNAEKMNEEDVTAFSEINKTDNYSSMKVNIVGRYLININGNDKTDISFLKKIAESINLKKLKEEKI